MNGPTIMFLVPFVMYLNDMDQYITTNYSDNYKNAVLSKFINKWNKGQVDFKTGKLLSKYEVKKSELNKSDKISIIYI